MNVMWMKIGKCILIFLLYDVQKSRGLAELLNCQLNIELFIIRVLLSVFKSIIFLRSRLKIRS